MTTDAPLVLFDDDTLSALDPATGTPRWTVKLPDCRSGMSRLVVRDDVVVVAGYEHLCCIGLADGRLYWKVPTRKTPRYGVVVRDGRVFVYKSGAVDCYDGHGRLVWSREGSSHYGGSFGFPDDVCWVPDVR